MKIVLTESLGIPDSALDELVKPFTDAGHAFVKYEKTADTAVLREETKDADVIMLANIAHAGGGAEAV